MGIDKILNDIQNQGYSVQENLFSREDLLSLQNDILTAYHNNSLKNAGIGRTADLEKNIRGDQILWLTKETLSAAQKNVWDFLETLKKQVNQNFYFGLKDFETHITVYPKNTFYKKHIDQFKKNEVSTLEKTRKLSFIVYLNSEWNESDGGVLKIYDSNDHNRVLESVLPQFGRVVIFLSEDFPHEVLETKKERISMTGWFYT